MMLHADGWLPPGLVSACSPWPVHDVVFLRFSSVQARVSSAPHFVAAVAQSRNDDAVCVPSSEMSPPLAVTRSMNC